MQVELIMLTEGMLSLLLEAPKEFEREYNIQIESAAGVLHAAAEMTLSVMRKTGAPHRWCGYLGIDPVTRQAVGTCGCTHEPTAEGEVEIAYFTFPGHEGRGVGTSMARQLTDLELNDPAVSMVVAHTLPEESASTTILRKIGFSLQGDHFDPEHGRVWKWSKKKASD